MSGARLVFSTDGIEELTRDLEGMAGRAVDMTKWARDIAELIMLRSAQQNFIAQGRPNRWDDLAEATIAARRNRDSSSVQILRDTGLLMQSLAPVGAVYGPAGNQYSIRRISPTFAEVGTNRPGADAHQDGTTNAGRGHQTTIPARPFLLFQAQDVEDLASTAADFIVEGSITEVRGA